MAKVEIKAGATLDTLTEPELDRALSKFLVSWRKEVHRGVTFRRFSRSGVVDAAGELVIGGASSSSSGLGPEESMVWGVTRVNIANLASATTGVVRLYRNDVSDSTQVKGDWTITNTSTSHHFGTPGIILRPGDALLVTGTTLTAGTTVTVAGDAIEVPFNLAWQLV
jgi:hypothetical protein